jgi:hypothetical protein
MQVEVLHHASMMTDAQSLLDFLKTCDWIVRGQENEGDRATLSEVRVFTRQEMNEGELLANGQLERERLSDGSHVFNIYLG